MNTLKKLKSIKEAYKILHLKLMVRVFLIEISFDQEALMHDLLWVQASTSMMG